MIETSRRETRIDRSERLSRILVVDDDPGVLRVIQLTLEDYGHDVISTGDPKAVMGLVRQEKLDAVILDVMMPEVSGWELLETLRHDAGAEHVPVVMLSALGEVEHRVRGLRQGADDYLRKPFDPEELVARVEGIIARKPKAAAGLEGTFEVQSFVELIQSLDQGSKTGVLHLRSGGRSGRVELHGGRLFRARFDSLKGQEAVMAMCELSSGRFRFGQEEETASESRRAPDWPSEVRVQPILLEAAWVRDSLDVVAEHLPPEDRPLRALGAPPEVSEELEGLPFAEILQRLEDHQLSVRELLPGVPFAPNRVRLAVAWLCKEGAIEAMTKEDPDAAVSEGLDAAIREFLQAAVFRGCSLDGEGSREVRIDFWVADSSWDSVASLLLSLPRDLLVGKDRERRREVFLARGGALRLAHPAGSFVLGFRLLSAAPEDPGGDSPVGGVLFPGSLEEEIWTGLAQGLVRDGCSVLVASPLEDQRRLRRALDELPRWRHLAEPVRNLEYVLAELSLIEA